MSTSVGYSIPVCLLPLELHSSAEDHLLTLGSLSVSDFYVFCIYMFFFAFLCTHDLYPIFFSLLYVQPPCLCVCASYFPACVSCTAVLFVCVALCIQCFFLVCVFLKYKLAVCFSICIVHLHLVAALCLYLLALCSSASLSVLLINE